MGENESIDKNDETFEIIQVDEDSNPPRSAWFRKVLQILPPKNQTSDMAIGAISGWAVGYVFKKVGRIAAASLGGSLCILQIAHQSGYITFDWRKVNRDIRKTKRIINNGINGHHVDLEDNISKIKTILNANAALSLGIASGFLLGVAS